MRFNFFDPRQIATQDQILKLVNHAAIAQRGTQIGGEAAFDTARNLKEPKPRVILFNTLMGKGVPFLETRDKNHFIRVDPPEWQQALAILDQNAPEGVAA